jgi:hypothetical protein
VIRWAEHVESREENYKPIGKSEVNEQDLGVGVRIILKSYVSKQDGRAWAGCVRLMTRFGEFL